MSETTEHEDSVALSRSGGEAMSPAVQVWKGAALAAERRSVWVPVPTGTDANVKAAASGLRRLFGRVPPGQLKIADTIGTIEQRIDSRRRAQRMVGCRGRQPTNGNYPFPFARLLAQAAFIRREIAARCAAVNLRRPRARPATPAPPGPLRAARAARRADSCDSSSTIVLSSTLVTSVMERYFIM